MPTGSGKNYVIIHSMEDNEKYLILVPRIILMDQLFDEIIKFKPHLKNQIQLIGDKHTTFTDKLITICVYNSIEKLNLYLHTFKKIFVDEAHHINYPDIYDCSSRNDLTLNINSGEYSNCSDEDSSGSSSDDSSDSSSDSDDSSDSSSDSDDSSDLSSDSDDSSDSSSDSDQESITNTETNASENLHMLKYRQIIKSLRKYNNNVYLSATIDEIEGFTYYKQDIRDMINKNYLCDYILTVPIFSSDPDNNKIADYILNNYKNMIIYCATQKEGIIFNNLLNTKQKNISKYVDCHTSKKDRQQILKDFDDGLISFLVNVRILEEGFNSPITKGCILLHMPSSKTKIIEIIGSAFRIHKTKQFTNIILPCSSNDDTDNISKFKKITCENDYKIKNSIQKKKLSGYLSMDIVENDNNQEIDIEEAIFKYDKIYNNLDIENLRFTNWLNKLEEIKSYLNTYKKKPRQNSKNINEKKIGIWLATQIINYKQKTYIMNQPEIYNIWTEFINNHQYKIYFLTTN